MTLSFFDDLSLAVYGRITSTRRVYRVSPRVSSSEISIGGRRRAAPTSLSSLIISTIDRYLSNILSRIFLLEAPLNPFNFESIILGYEIRFNLACVPFFQRRERLSFARILDLISIIASDRLGTVFKGYKLARLGRGYKILDIMATIFHCLVLHASSGFKPRDK